MKSYDLQVLAMFLLFVLLLISVLTSCNQQQTMGSLQAGSLSSASGATDAPALGQQTMIFQDGVSPDGSYAGTTDVILASDANQNANLGGAEHIEVYFADSEARRSLVRWDLSALPDEVTIKSATVELYRYGGEANSEIVLGLYRLTSSWVEGSGDDFFPVPSYLPDGATWMTTDGSTSWVNAGGDYDPSLIAFLTLPAAMANGWISLDATEAVRAWVDGQPNDGLLLRPQSGDYSYHYFYSRNGQIATQRPRLIINYTVGGSTPSPTSTALPVTATATQAPTSGLLYLPLIVRAAAETPTATPTVITSSSPTPVPTAPTGSLPTESRIYPTDFVYQGAFRLPNETSNNSSWGYGGSGMTFYPAGDPANTDDYPGSLFSIGHPYEGLVSEFSIPVPVISPNKEINDLPIATTLQPFAELTNGQQNGDLTGLILGDIQYYPRQGSQSSDKLYWVMSQYYQPLDEISHGWSEMDMSNPQSQGNWRLAGFPTAATNKYLFEIPRSWADRYTPGQYLLAGRQRAVNNGSWGAALYAFGPWNDGNPPPNGSAVAATQLLYYPWGDEYIADHANKDFSYFDSWEDGAWLTKDDRAGVIISGLKSLRTKHGPVYEYYGLANIDGCSEDKGYHAEPYTGAIQFYDPTLLAAVVQGMLESYQIQPYALFNPEDYLFQEGCRSNTLGGVGYDRERGILYIIEKVVLADESKPILHVFRLAEQAQAPDFTAPTAPTLQLDSATANEVTFSWDAASDNTHLVGYIIYRYGEPIATTTESQYTDDNVNANASYTYSVVAWDSSSNLSPPTHLTVNTPAGGADSRVPIISNIKYSGLSDTSITINWQTDEPATTVFTYTIEYSGNELLYEDNSLTTNHQATLTGLTPESRYYIPAFVSSDAAGNRNAFSSESWGFTTSPAGSQLNFRPFLNGIGAQRLQIGESLTLTLQGLDRDADDMLTYSATNLPAGATFDPATGQFSWTAKAAGSYQMTFTVSDGDQSDSEQVTVFVMGE